MPDTKTTTPDTAAVVVTATINKRGYLVTSRLGDEGIRTYACADLPALHSLIMHLTQRPAWSFEVDHRGLPMVSGLGIAAGLHIYTTETMESADAK